MAYNKISDAVVRKVCKKYGEGSVECQVIALVRETRVPYECIAEVMKCNAEQVRQDLTGTFKMDDQAHTMMVRFLTTVLPLGLERGVLPCKDTALTSSVLRLLVELCGHKQIISNLKTQVSSLQEENNKG